MTQEKARALVELFDELATSRAFAEVCQAAGDYDTNGDARAIKDRIVALLAEVEGT